MGRGDGMSSDFYTRVCGNENSYEITFHTDDREKFEAVQELCRKLIGHSKNEVTE